MSLQEKSVERKLIANTIQNKPDSVDSSDLLYFVLQVSDCVHSVIGIFHSEDDAVSVAMRAKKENDGYAFFVKGRESYLSQNNISTIEISEVAVQ